MAVNPEQTPPPPSPREIDGAPVPSLADAVISRGESPLPAAGNDYRVMVLLVDDQVMVCEAIRRALANEPEVDLHYCADAREALTSAAHLRPTVILQDLIMPGLDGLSLVSHKTPASCWPRKSANCPPAVICR